MPRRNLFAVLALVSLCGLCISLGMWQLRRYDYKLALQTRFDQAGDPVSIARSEELAAWRRVRLQGRWVAAGTVFIDNHSYRGTPGYFVLTPLQLDNAGGAVMVNRGWAPTGEDRRVLPAVPTSPDPVVLTGLALPPVQGGFSLGESNAEPRVWQRIEPQRFKTLVAGTVATLVVQQESTAADGLVRDWPRPDFGLAMHRGYALQWFSFAAMAAGFAALLLYRSWQRRNKTDMQ